MGQLLAEGQGNGAAGTGRLMPGETAPKFCLPDPDMGVFDLERALTELRGVILHFYLHDAMPSSLRQALDFTEREQDFARGGVRIVCISIDECQTHAAFRDENGIAIELLSDPDGEVCRLYGVWYEQIVGEIVRPVVQRATFVVGCDGRVRHADYNIDVRDHADRLLALIDTFTGRENGDPQEHRRHA